MNAADVIALGVAPLLASPPSSDDGQTSLWSFPFRRPRESVRRRLHWFLPEGHRMRPENNPSPAANVNVLDLTHDAICVRSMDGVIEYWNRAAEGLYGWRADEAAGRVSHALFKTVFPVPLDRIEAELLRTGCWEGELVQMRKDGTRVTVASRWSLVSREASAPVAILETSNDITERKRAEAERAKLEARLREAERMEGIGRFASGIAHDFNSVLAGILAYGEMLFDEAPDDSPQKRHAQNVLTAATRGRELVQQILAYSRSQRARCEPTDVCATVAETLELLRASVPASVALKASIPEAPLVVMGHATQFHQLVMNVCRNSLQAMSEGGTLHVAIEPTEVPAQRPLSHGNLGQGRCVCLRVEDSGCGMDEATLARIFEPFYTTKELGRGTGLGLALVYAIVTDLGGAIDVKSVRGEGSTFSIYTPIADASGAAGTRA